MIAVPSEIAARFIDFLKKRSVPSVHHNYYKKWLRYYLDYCAKYGLSNVVSKSMTQFLGKLREKKQTVVQIKQAGHAVSLYLDLIHSMRRTPDSATGTTAPGAKENQEAPSIDSSPHPVTCISCPAVPKIELSAWDRVVAKLVSVIKTRHYSPKTSSPTGIGY